MATLSDYLASEGAMSLTALSAAVGVSKARLSQLRDSREWPGDLALNVERETGGLVDASTLSPTVARARGVARETSEKEQAA